MNLQQLNYFVAVAKSRSFTRASESCFVAQPALSQQIRKLEEELGLPVFERRPQGVTLTAAGAAFLEYAQEALRQVEQGKRRVSDLREVNHTVVTITCLPTVAAYWLPEILALHRSQCPGTEIAIRETAGITPEDLDMHEDLALVQLPEDPSCGDPSVHVERLFVDEQVLVLPPEHRLYRGAVTDERVPLRELADEPLILPSPGCGMTRTIARALADARVTPCVRLQTSQIEAIYAMVAAGLGIGIIPMMALNRTHPAIRWRRLADPVPQRTIALALSSSRALSTAASSLVSMIRAAARKTAERENHPVGS